MTKINYLWHICYSKGRESAMVTVVAESEDDARRMGDNRVRLHVGMRFDGILKFENNSLLPNGVIGIQHKNFTPSFWSEMQKKARS